MEQQEPKAVEGEEQDGEEEVEEEDVAVEEEEEPAVQTTTTTTSPTTTVTQAAVTVTTTSARNINEKPWSPYEAIQRQRQTTESDNKVRMSNDFQVSLHHKIP